MILTLLEIQDWRVGVSVGFFFNRSAEMNDPLNDPRPPPPPKNRIEKDRAHYFEFGETGIFAILEVVLECMHISSTLYAPDSNRSIVYSYKSVPKGGKKYSTIRRIHWKCLKFKMNESLWVFIYNMVWRYVDPAEEYICDWSTISQESPVCITAVVPSSSLTFALACFFGSNIQISIIYVGARAWESRGLVLCMVDGRPLVISMN